MPAAVKSGTTTTWRRYSARDRQVIVKTNEAPTEGPLMEVLAELLDDRPQIIPVLLDNPACRLQTRRLGLRRFLNRAWPFWRFHVPDGRRKPNGTIELNQPNR